ncbi:glycoside hydrolase family 43 protein [Sediminitomix flava]|uniref:Glycosyl hydrolase family 43 n=1 Tax=Sediminitomix flava TaxID=379075 RepID=A0A315Z4U5_SEDFL|nr:family 43 glycosylhydrolase [Sediminitomix flava]PWJ37893.1 glycosyl hydrolase family 43 [Sediminitomix flava]
MSARISFLVISFFGLLFGACQNSHEKKAVFEYQNPISDGLDPKGLRDCQVLKDGDWWYLTGTSYPHWSRQENENDPSSLNKGVALYRSKDMLKWEFVKYIVERPQAEKWYYRRFWAPEIQKIKGKYYALFNCRNDELGYVGQFGGYAVADQIEGPYTVVTDEKPLMKGNDLTFFEEEDGSVYAFWNQGRQFGIGFAKIDLEKGEFLTKPQSAIRPGKVDYALDEHGNRLKEPAYDGRLKDKVAKYHTWDAIGIEGAYVIKNKETYYLFYSSWTRGYEIGYATSDKITGPWVKYESNPFYGAMNKDKVAQAGFEWSGDPNSPFNQVGHNEIFKGPDGRYWLSCHGIQPGGSPYLVYDPIWFDEDGNMQSNGPTYTKQSIVLN